MNKEEEDLKKYINQTKQTIKELQKILYDKENIEKSLLKDIKVLNYKIKNCKKEYAEYKQNNKNLKTKYNGVYLIYIKQIKNIDIFISPIKKYQSFNKTSSSLDESDDKLNISTKDEKKILLNKIKKIIKENNELELENKIGLRYIRYLTNI